MKLSDVMVAMQLAAYAEIGLVLFLFGVRRLSALDVVRRRARRSSARATCRSMTSAAAETRAMTTLRSSRRRARRRASRRLRVDARPLLEHEYDGIREYDNPHAALVGRDVLGHVLLLVRLLRPLPRARQRHERRRGYEQDDAPRARGAQPSAALAKRRARAVLGKLMARPGAHAGRRSSRSASAAPRATAPRARD